jgi:hypothetical protein
MIPGDIAEPSRLTYDRPGRQIPEVSAMSLLLVIDFGDDRRMLLSALQTRTRFGRGVRYGA